MLALTTCLHEFVAPLLFAYRICPDRIQIVVLGLPLANIMLRDVTDIRKVSLLDTFNPGTLSLHNRLCGQWLLIRKNRGLFTRVLITPDNPDEFIETVARNRRSSSPDHVLAREHSSRNRDEILASTHCGCFYCTSVFKPFDVADWVKDERGETAICPKCGIDAVLGDRAGYPLTEDFLRRMHDRWF
jgi:hypothetical protein